MACHALTEQAADQGPAEVAGYTNPTPLAARLRARRRRGGRAHPHQTLPVRLRPSHAQHFARWLSIPAQRAVELFDELAGELEQVELDRTPGWTMAGDTSTPPQPHRGSAYWATSRPSWPPSASGERLYPGAAATRGLTPAGQAGNYPVLLVNGAVGGVWHQQRPCRSLAITVEPLDELTATQRRQLQDEVDLVGAVMEATPTLTVGTVTVGPHG